MKLVLEQKVQALIERAIAYEKCYRAKTRKNALMYWWQYTSSPSKQLYAVDRQSWNGY